MKSSMKIAKLVFLTAVFVSLVSCLDNGLARIPPMGWMDWERFRCNIDCDTDPDNCIGERLFTRIADRMVSDGYREAGYVYVSIDDCWMSKQRDSQMRLQADPKRFPHGIKWLADYMHKRGLKLGIYEDFGTKTCGGYPGSEFFLMSDAQTFADWGVDMLKLDGCHSHQDQMSIGYPTMGLFLNKTGRPILYSCSWPAYTGSGKKTDYQLIAKYCNMWRNYKDIEDSWDSVYGIIQFYAKDRDNFSSVAGPGNWNDPDQLIIGNFGLSWTQQRVQMGMWAIMASPLFMSVDLDHIEARSRSLLLNRRVLAINQDKLGIQGTQIMSKATALDVWGKPILPKGSMAVAVLNGDNKGVPRKAVIQLKELGLIHSAGYNVTETFEGKPLGNLLPDDKLTVVVNPSGIYLFTAVPIYSGAKHWERYPAI